MFTVKEKILCEVYGAMKKTLSSFNASAGQQGHERPEFDLHQFMNWVTNQPNYDEISMLWAETGFGAVYRPKMRIKNKIPNRYTLSNLELSNAAVLTAEYEAKKNII